MSSVGFFSGDKSLSNKTLTGSVLAESKLLTCRHKCDGQSEETQTVHLFCGHKCDRQSRETQIFHLFQLHVPV